MFVEWIAESRKTGVWYLAENKAEFPSIKQRYKGVWRRGRKPRYPMHLGKKQPRKQMDYPLGRRYAIYNDPNRQMRSSSPQAQKISRAFPTHHQCSESTRTSIADGGGWGRWHRASRSRLGTPCELLGREGGDEGRWEEAVGWAHRWLKTKSGTPII